MSVFDAVAYVVGEGVTYLAGRAVGRVFKVERERSLQIGQWLVLGAVGIGGLALCLVYT